MKYFLQTYSTTIFFYLFIILVELYVLFIIQTQYQETTIQIPSFSNKMVEPPSDDRTTPPSEDVTTPPPKNVTTPPPLLEDVTLPPNDTTTTLLSDDSQETTENNTGKIILLLLQIFVIVYLIALYFKKFPPEPEIKSGTINNTNLYIYRVNSNFYKIHLFSISIVGTITMIISFVLYSTSPLDITNFVLAWIYFFLDVGFFVYFYTKKPSANISSSQSEGRSSSKGEVGSSSKGEVGSSSSFVKRGTYTNMCCIVDFITHKQK